MPPLAALLPLALKTAIGLKLVGIAISWATSATSANTRRTFIEHIEHVRDGLKEANLSLTNEEDASLLARIATLKASAGVGWTTPSETHALFEVLRFLSWSHAHATASGVSKLTSSHVSAAMSFAGNLGSQAFESIFGKPKPKD